MGKHLPDESGNNTAYKYWNIEKASKEIAEFDYPVYKKSQCKGNSIFEYRDENSENNGVLQCIAESCACEYFLIVPESDEFDVRAYSIPACEAVIKASDSRNNDKSKIKYKSWTDEAKENLIDSLLSEFIHRDFPPRKRGRMAPLIE